jgi:hypothetical protein
LRLREDKDAEALKNCVIGGGTTVDFDFLQARDFDFEQMSLNNFKLSRMRSLPRSISVPFRPEDRLCSMVTA